MTKEELLKELRRCILCGGCKTECPTYLFGARESLGPRGRVRILYRILTGEFSPSQAASDRIFSCLLCGACSGRCSVGVDIEMVLVEGRRFLTDYDDRRRIYRRVLPFMLRRRGFSSSVARLSRFFLSPLLNRRGLEMLELPPGTEQFSRGGVYPPPDPMTRKGRVILYGGCAPRFFQPHLIYSLIRVCNLSGYEVVIPEGEACCGSPLLALGALSEAEAMMRKNMKVFERFEHDFIVTLCPTCALTLRDRYRSIWGRGLPIQDSVEFLKGVIRPEGDLGVKGYYHDPCHARYGLGLYEEPRDLLRRLSVEVVGESGDCCGLPLMLSGSDWGIRDGLFKKKKGEVDSSGAEMIITACPGCMYQLGGLFSEDRVFHLIEMVEEALVGAREGEDQNRV